MMTKTVATANGYVGINSALPNKKLDKGTKNQHTVDKKL